MHSSVCNLLNNTGIRQEYVMDPHDPEQNRPS